MKYEWDETKSLANVRKHGIGFEEVENFDWDLAAGLETQIVEHQRR